MSQKGLSHPSQLEPAIHAKISAMLSELVEKVRNGRSFTGLRLRDWDLTRRDGVVVCDVVLDKGHSWLQYDDFIGHPARDHNLEVVNIDECVAVHKALLDSPDIMNLFDDSVHFEIGSAGEEPPLRNQEDFEMATGFIVSIETWTKTSKRAKTQGRLLRVTSLPEGGAFRIEIEAPVASGEPGQSVAAEPILMESPSIKRAALLLFDPGNFAKP